MAAATATPSVTSPATAWHAARIANEPEAIRVYERVNRAHRNPLSKLGTKSRPNRDLLRAAGVDYDTYLTLMACYPDLEVAQWVLRHPDLPEPAFQVLACYPDLRVVTEVIHHRNVPGYILDHFAGHPSSYVRRDLPYVAPKLSVEVQRRLAGDPDSEVRILLGERPDLDPEVLTLLTQDPDESVVDTAIENPRLPLDILKSFLTDLADTRGTLPSWTYTLLNVALYRKRSDLIGQVVEVITTHGLNDMWPDVLANPKTPMSVLRQKSTKVRSLPAGSQLALAHNPKTPAEALEYLGTKKSKHIRAALAQNPSTPAQTLTSLAHLGKGDLLGRLAQNPSTPGDVLTWIGQGNGCPDGCCGPNDNHRARIDAWGNPNMPLSAVVAAPALDGISALPSHPDIPTKTLLRWFNDLRAGVTQDFRDLHLDPDELNYDYLWDDLIPAPLLDLLDYPGSPTETMLTKMVTKTAVPPLRVCALQHPKFPTDLLLQECMNPVRPVREAALAHPDCPEEGRVAASLMALNDPDEDDDY